MRLKYKKLNNVAYIRILQELANQAVNYQIKETAESEKVLNDGITYGEFINADNIKTIDENWLKKTLPSICYIYNDDNKVDNVRTSDITDSTKLVIKAEEFMKFINLVEHENTTSALRTGSYTLLATILAVLISVFALTISVHNYNKVQSVKIDSFQIERIINSLDQINEISLANGKDRRAN